ncbi:hypothetical protein KDL01_11960 [Actinospica durhamensis]|uniref:Uncharacterized protein n=1 Tax=Actinospica durhamensis TaxID=1508375 RepID=A0A941INH6_9ACTN|nr:hypothetical protein [Actinospica durhamensis]MBR7833984.1 hypothetical protein [Actinospica durhamensis]
MDELAGGQTAVFVRYQATQPGRTGLRSGVFGLVNGLHKRGELTPEQAEFRRVGNAWYHAHLSDPGALAPEVYDRALHPRSSAWFKESAVEMIEQVAGYLEILDAHGVAWELVRSTDPGEILYEDVHQVIAEPRQAVPSAGTAPLRSSGCR